MMIKLNADPKSDIVVKIGNGYVLVSYDRKGCLRLIREAKGGQIPGNKPKKDETVFRVIDLQEGSATFKSSSSHCGFYSINGTIYWSTIWDDDYGSIFKKCSFQDWASECAQVLAGAKESVSPT